MISFFFFFCFNFESYLSNNADGISSINTFSIVKSGVGLYNTVSINISTDQLFPAFIGSWKC
jgi:hypothetical protein